jgi:hypothetical protein
MICEWEWARIGRSEFVLSSPAPPAPPEAAKVTPKGDSILQFASFPLLLLGREKSERGEEGGGTTRRERGGARGGCEPPKKYPSKEKYSGSADEQRGWRKEPRPRAAPAREALRRIGTEELKMHRGGTIPDREAAASALDGAVEPSMRRRRGQVRPLSLSLSLSLFFNPRL